MENRIFQFALIISLVIHIAVFTKLSYSNLNLRKRPLKNIEIAYHILKTQRVDIPQDKVQLPQIDKELKNKTEIFLKKKTQKSPFIKDIAKVVDRFTGHNKQPAYVASSKKKHKIVVPALKSEEIDIPEYQLYYHDIRRLIRDRALTNIDFSKFDTGDVYLTFVVSSDGILKQLQILDERSRASQYLRQVSIESVREASKAFTNFPEDLQYSELPFNVVISFQVEE